MAGVKIGERCAMHGCKKKMAPDSDLCKSHLACAKKRSKKPKPQEILTALCAAVAAKYKNEGDRTKAGVVIAELQHSPSRFYASVAHYPDGPMHEVIVLQVGRSISESFTTAEEAVVALAQKFAEEAVVALAQKFADDNRPAPVKETLETLDAMLVNSKYADEEGAASPGKWR